MFYTTLLYFVLLFTFLNLHFKSKMELILAGNKVLYFLQKLIRKHFNEKAKEAMEEMVQDIRQQFNTILNTISWMDEKTKTRAKVTATLLMFFCFNVMDCGKVFYFTSESVIFHIFKSVL